MLDVCLLVDIGLDWFHLSWPYVNFQSFLHFASREANKEVQHECKFDSYLMHHNFIIIVINITITHAIILCMPWWVVCILSIFTRKRKTPINTI